MCTAGRTARARGNNKMLLPAKKKINKEKNNFGFVCFLFALVRIAFNCCYASCGLHQVSGPAPNNGNALCYSNA